MSAEFNDDQIADEKSISNMKIKYATLNPFQKVKVLQEEQTQDKAVLAGQALQDANKYLQFLQDQSSGDMRDYVGELRRVNNLELDELRSNFDSLKDIDKKNPRLICRPYNTCMLNRQIAKNELLALSELFELYAKETRPEVRQNLERIIRRRIELINTLSSQPANRNNFNL